MVKKMMLLITTFFLLFETTNSIVSNGFQACREFFYKNEPPQLRFAMPNTYQCLCEVYKNMNYFATLYDTFNKIPVYSAYKADDFSMPNNEEVKRQWRKGGGLEKTKQPFLKDYNGVQAKNLNRGHLAPRFYFDTTDGRKATDVLTNIAPQYDKFNQVTWYSLETDIFEASRHHCKNINGLSYFLTGVIPSPNLPHNLFKEKINIPSRFWTAVCCDTSGARVAQKNKFKGWSFAYSAANYNFEKPPIDIFPIDVFLKYRTFGSRYHKLFKDIVVANGNKQPMIVRNCLFDSENANEIIKIVISNNPGATFSFH